MKNLLALAAAALLAFAGMGWYLDWYRVRTVPSTTPGQRHVNIDINTNKILDDWNKGIQKGGQKIQQVLEKADLQPSVAPLGPFPPRAGAPGTQEATTGRTPLLP